MNLTELIPSADIREHMQQTGRVFGDSEWAAILFNSNSLTPEEKTARLRELGGQTRDQVLAEQIRQRLALEEEMRDAFFRSTPGMFYMVSASEDRMIPMGYYAGVEDAVQRGKREGVAFEVYKCRLIGTPDLPPPRKVPHGNPYLFKSEPISEEPELPDDGLDHCWAGYASFNEQGELYDVTSNEPTSVSMAEYVEMIFSPQRFENRYLELPNPFQRGDIIRVVSGIRSGECGVVETSQEEWVRFNQRVKDGLVVDYSDACVTVEFLTGQGSFSHEHISPLYLERCRPGKDDPDRGILEAASLILRGECGLDYFMDCCLA